MTPFEAYTTYLALKQHFTTKNYDYFKYGGKIKANEKSFELRKDKYFFYKLSKKKEVDCYLIANFMDNRDGFAWIGNLINSKESESYYYNWKRKQESLSYVYKEDLSKMDHDIDDLIKITNGSRPELLQLYRYGDICIETLVILNKLINFIPYIDKHINDTLFWPELKIKLEKYTPFVNFDEKKFREITLQHFS